MNWLFFLFNALVWGGILVSCFPGVWPGFVHDAIEGHHKLKAETVVKTEIVQIDKKPLAMAEPLRTRLLEDFNAAHFLKRVDVDLDGITHLRFTLQRDREVYVLAARSEDDIYIVRMHKGKMKSSYWAREPELYRFLVLQKWRSVRACRWPKKVS